MTSKTGVVFLVFTLSILFSFKINAQTFKKEAPIWMFVTQSTDVKVYVQSEYISKQDKQVKIWTKWVYRRPHKSGNKTYEDYYCKQLAIWDLNDKQYKVITMAFYGDGNYVDDYTPESEEWTDIIPDSCGEGILEKIVQLFY